MSTSGNAPGLPSGNAITSGASWPKQLQKTCGPACIVSPLYVLLNLESRRPVDALKELPNVLGEHSGHTTVYLVLDAPSVIEGRLFLELHGLWKDGRLQSSFLGPANPALYHPDWSKPRGLEKKRKSVRLESGQGKRAAEDRGGAPVPVGSDTQQPEPQHTGQHMGGTQALCLPSETYRFIGGLWKCACHTAGYQSRSDRP